MTTCQDENKLWSVIQSLHILFCCPLTPPADIHLLRLPGPRVCAAEPWPRMRDHTKQHARHDCIDILPRPAHPHLRAVHAEHIPNGGSEHVRHLPTPFHRGLVVHTTRDPTTIRACASSRADIRIHHARVSITSSGIRGPSHVLVFIYITLPVVYDCNSSVQPNDGGHRINRRIYRGV